MEQLYRTRTATVVDGHDTDLVIVVYDHPDGQSDHFTPLLLGSDVLSRG